MEIFRILMVGDIQLYTITINSIKSYTQNVRILLHVNYISI